MDLFSSIPQPFPTASVDEEMPDAQRPPAASDAETEDKSLDLSDNESQEFLTVAEKVALALSSREDGNRKLKEGDLPGAMEAYETGLKKIKNLEEVAENEIRASLRDVRLALNLNLSLCKIKSGAWFAASKAASAALEIDKENVKGLFRRGIAYSRQGHLEEARADLLNACKLDPSNAEARKELADVKKREVEARAREKQAFGGLFSKATGLYQDREKQMEEEKRKQAEKLKEEMHRFEEENRGRESRGEAPIVSFDEWKKQKQEKEEADKKRIEAANSQSRTSKPSKVDASEFDEEDQKILDETKKMGYCYFNRKIDAEEKELLQKQNKPQKLEATESVQEPQNQKAISSWNSQGTTYEEKDCSSWARTTLSDRLKKISVTLDPPRNIEQIQQHLETSKSMGAADTATLRAAARLLPLKLSVSSVSAVEGESQIIVLRGSKRYLFDLKFDITWTASLTDIPLLSSLADLAALDPKTLCGLLNDAGSMIGNEQLDFSGSVNFADVSSASSSRAGRADWLDDARVMIKSQPSTPLHKEALRLVIDVLKDEVQNSVKSFEDDFKALF